MKPKRSRQGRDRNETEMTDQNLISMRRNCNDSETRAAYLRLLERNGMQEEYEMELKQTCNCENTDCSCGGECYAIATGEYAAQWVGALCVSCIGSMPQEWHARHHGIKIGRPDERLGGCECNACETKWEEYQLRLIQEYDEEEISETEMQRIRDEIANLSQKRGKFVGRLGGAHVLARLAQRKWDDDVVWAQMRFDETYRELERGSYLLNEEEIGLDYHMEYCEGTEPRD